MTEKAGKERRTDVDECLDDMRASAEAIERYILGIGEERFTQEEMRQDAVVRRLEMIGEAADRIMKAEPDDEKTLPGIALVEAKRDAKPGDPWLRSGQHKGPVQDKRVDFVDRAL